MIRFQSTFRNIDNKLYDVQIIDTEYTGDPYLFVVDSSGFVRELQQSGDANLSNPIVAQVVSVTLYIDPIRTEWEQFVVDLLASGNDTRFQLYITEDAAPYWRGLIDVASLVIPDRYYSKISITASDGFGLLESMPYDDNGTLYTGWETIAGHITNILGKLNLFTSGRMFAYVGKFQHQPMGALLPSGIRWQHDAFKEIKDDSTLPFDCLTVLRQILTRFHLRIIQSGGIFYLQDINTLSESGAVEVDYYLYNGNFDAFANETLNVATINKLAGGSRWYREQIKTAEVQYAYSDSISGTNLLTGLMTQEQEYNIGEIPHGNGEAVGFGFNFRVYHEEDLSGTVIFRVQFIFTVRQGIYYLTNEGGSYAWINDNTKRVKLYSYQLYRDFDTITFTEQIGFITAATEQTAEMFVTWDYILTGLNGVEVFPTGYTEVEVTSNRAVLIYGVGMANEGTIVTTALSGNKSGEQVRIDVLAIGDKPYLRSVGRMQYYDGAAWVNTTTWAYGTGESLSIDQLLAREIVAMQRTPIEMTHYELWSDVTVYKKINGRIIINGRYVANQGIWSLDTWLPVVDRTGITFTDYVDAEMGDLPGGISGGGDNDGHLRLHSVTDPLDHSAAAVGDRDKLIGTNASTGLIEFVTKLWKRVGTVLSPVTAGDSIDAGTGYLIGALKATKILAKTDGVTAIQITKADGTTVLLNLDSTNQYLKYYGSMSVCAGGSDIAPKSSFDIYGSLGYNVRKIVAASGGTTVSMQDTESTYIANCVAGNVTINLQDASNVPRRVVTIRHYSGANNLIIEIPETEVIYGGAGSYTTLIITTGGHWVTLQSVLRTGTTYYWYVIASYPII